MLTDQECLEKLLPELSAIPADELRPPDVPIDRAVRAGEKMAAAAVQDIERFAAIGLPVDIVVQLDEALAALRVAETRYQLSCVDREAALELWKGKAPEGRRLRRELLAAQTYAFRKFSTPLEKIRRSPDDESPAAMIRDLTELSALGRRHSDMLVRINFDLSILDLSARQAQELELLYARVCAAGDSGEARQLRDRAFNRVSRIMAEIADAARYVLRNDPVRLAVYYSDISRTSQTSATHEMTASTPVQ